MFVDSRLVQGFRSATPHFIPAYDLASLTGLFYRTTMKKFIVHCFYSIVFIYFIHLVYFI